MTASALHTRPRSRALPQVQGLVHAADPDALKADHAPRVDAGQHLDRVTGPGGDLGVAGTPELSRQVTPEWRRSYGRFTSGEASCRAGPKRDIDLSET
jgi:hypothetical protein